MSCSLHVRSFYRYDIIFGILRLDVCTNVTTFMNLLKCFGLLLQHILRRIDEVGRNFRLRILLVLVDDEENLAALTDLNKIAFATNFTLLFAWSNQECARYLETFKNYESKSSVSIQSRDETEFLPKLQKVLGNIRSINKTNVTTLMDVFGDFESVCQTTELQLVMCPGLGEKKVKRLLQVLQEPFESRKQAKFDHSLSIQNLEDDSTTIEDPSKKYEIHNWHNSNEDVANALRHNNVLDEPVEAEVMQTSVSSTSKPTVSNSSTGAEDSIDLELVIDSEVFGFDDDD